MEMEMPSIPLVPALPGTASLPPADFPGDDTTSSCPIAAKSPWSLPAAFPQLACVWVRLTLNRHRAPGRAKKLNLFTTVPSQSPGGVPAQRCTAAKLQRGQVPRLQGDGSAARWPWWPRSWGKQCPDFPPPVTSWGREEGAA